MRADQLLILRGPEVEALLAGREHELVGVVRQAYLTHAAGATSLPHSSFLHFPGQEGNRIIALPAYLGGEFGVAGIKWIASFLDNHSLGLERASAVLILNSVETGLAEAVMEGSVISARRTAASAALAAQALHTHEKIRRVGVVGCGLINFEITRALLTIWPELSDLIVFDIDAESARRFTTLSRKLNEHVRAVVADDVKEVLATSQIISFATTAGRPHIHDLSMCSERTTILHISLRDLSPDVILSCDNVVDDVDHVCRARTSIHLAEQSVGHRDFVRCTLADVLRGTAESRAGKAPLVFSPFGLGVLDIAVGRMVYELARRGKNGTVIDSFLPTTELRGGGASPPPRELGKAEDEQTPAGD